MKTKYFAFLFLSLSISHQAAHGQGMVNGAVIGASAAPLLHHVMPAPEVPLSPLSSDVAISYFDSHVPTVDISVPTYAGGSLVPEYGERFTLPGAAGFLDSVQITFDSISRDSVEVDLAPDTLYTTAVGDFHLMNIFDQNAPEFAIGYVHTSDIHGRTTVTIPVLHTPLPSENFWISVVPNYDAIAGNFTNTFELVGDSEAIVPRTADNTHSGFIAEGGGQILSAVFDSTFLSAGGAPLYSNFYITAFVSSGPSTVSVQHSSSALSIFPNPASSSLQIQSGERVTSVEVLDLLGRMVLSQKLSGSGTLDVSRLEPGRYEAVVHSAGGIEIAPILIQR